MIMTIQEGRELVRSQIEDYNIEVGTTLILGNKTMECVGITEDRYGIRYMFDNGLGWTKSNIISNIIRYIEDGSKCGIRN